MKIVAMTVCCVDIYPQKQITGIGGNSVNFATQCVRSGVKQVAVLGSVGNDGHGAAIRRHLVKHLIDVSHLHTLPGSTASNDIYLTDTGETYSLPDSWRGGVYQEYRLSTEDWDFVRSHDIMAVISVDPNFRETLRQLTPANKLVVDFLDTRDFDLIEEAVPKIDLAFISGDAAVVERLTVLSKRVDILIVVTLGSEGSVAIRNGEPCYHKAVPVETVVDVTGCGDAYQAAFTIAWFENRGLKAALEAGSLAASRILGHVGGAN
jgi:fructoselysine 6-kinase